MKFKLEIDCDNDAFKEDDAELMRILELVASQVSYHPHGGSIRDANGNTVGYYGYEEATK